MICNIYRSDTKVGMYLYLANDKQMDDLPEELLKLIGKYTHAMELDLSDKTKLANEDIKKVKSNLKDQGYHVQLPRDIVKNVISYTQKHSLKGTDPLSYKDKGYHVQLPRNLIIDVINYQQYIG